MADDVSLAVLHLIMRRAGRKPLMVILLARPGELAQSRQASRLREASGALDLREVELQPLSEQESEEMLKSLLPTDRPVPSAAAKRALLRSAAGYPMVLELLVQDWQQSGEQSLALSIDAMTEAPSSEAPTGLPYKQIMERITKSIDTTTHNVLNLASLLGQRLNDLGMYTVVDLSVGQTMSGMAELVARRVLRDGPQGLEFVNEMVRASAYMGVTASVRRVLHSKIADRFIQEHRIGNGDLGLEIAWHCTRAGRINEATPHLLRGARESIRAGIPYSAERGLSTALPHIEGSDRTEALLLLAEALQEQGNWIESLAVLDSLEGSPKEKYTSDLAFVLGTKARWRLGYCDPAELAELPARFLIFIESKPHRTNLLRAAGEAACILNGIHSNVAAPQLLERVVALDDGTLGRDDKIRLLLAQAMLSYNLRDCLTSLKCVNEGIALLQRENGASSLLAMLHLGEGTLLTAQGFYAPAIPALLRAYQTALRIDNQTIGVQASINLSLVLTRLGEYEEAIRWAGQALATHMVDRGFPEVLQAAKSALISEAMLGRATLADAIIEEWSAKSTKLGSDISQAWRFYVADAYAMMGRNQQAVEQGWSAAHGENNESHMDFWVGPYARWVVRNSVKSGNYQYAHKVLNSLLLTINRYDAIDQAEVLNAKCWLASRLGLALPSDLADMLSRLGSLPPAVGDQLRRMGMLDFC
jgi:tetratricopeptide (TPR) repeat protein